jgi:hypothetical protein
MILEKLKKRQAVAGHQRCGRLFRILFLDERALSGFVCCELNEKITANFKLDLIKSF